MNRMTLEDLLLEFDILGLNYKYLNSKYYVLDIEFEIIENKIIFDKDTYNVNEFYEDIILLKMDMEYQH